MKVEVEAREIALKNSHGDIAIIPVKDVAWVKEKLEQGCHSCLDEYIDTLPMGKDYAEDGTVDPGDGFWKGLLQGVKKSVNPKNWGKPDMSAEKDFNSAYQKARSQGELEFIYKGNRYNTKYAGTPEQQLRETGITDEQLQGGSEFRRRVAKNVSPVAYGHLKSAAKSIILNTPEKYIEDANLPPWRLLPTKKDEKNRSEENQLFDRDILDQFPDLYGEEYKTNLDLLQLNMGVPQKYTTITTSPYKPSKSSENKQYYTFRNTGNQEELFDFVTSNFTGVDADKYNPTVENFIGSGQAKVVDYLDMSEKINYEKGGDAFAALGNFKLDVGEDEDGKYISFYDIIDYAPKGTYRSQNKQESQQTSSLGKPVEIYDRIYFRDHPEVGALFSEKQGVLEKYKEQEANYLRYSGANSQGMVDTSLSGQKDLKKAKAAREEMDKLEVHLKQIDEKINGRTPYQQVYITDSNLKKITSLTNKAKIKALQKELSHRGYKLPNSTKKDGSFDGVWGEETEAALRDWQSKNK